jgi:thioredoxin 1
MLDRLILFFVISIAIIVFYRVSMRLFLKRRTHLGLNLEQHQTGTPAILYFTTPDCMPCKTIQRPALDEISSIYGSSIQVIEVNALTQPELADSWGVLSVPTTFIIDAQGRPRRVNHGAARSEKLIRQLNEVTKDDSQQLLEANKLGRSVPEQTTGMD